MKAFCDKIMGILFSCCCRFKHYEEDEQIDERTRLLSSSKISAREGVDNYGPTLSSTPDLFNSTDNSIDNNNDERKCVEKELAKKLIDITAMNRPTIDRSEWDERVKTYEKRVALIKRPLVLTRSLSPPESPEEPLPERRFKAIEAEDLELITTLSERASEAVLKGFQIKSTESVIAPFKPWKRY